METRSVAGSIFVCLSHRLAAVADRVLGLGASSSTDLRESVDEREIKNTIPSIELFNFVHLAIEQPTIAATLWPDERVRTTWSRRGRRLDWTTILDALDRLLDAETDVDAAIAQLDSQSSAVAELIATKKGEDSMSTSFESSRLTDLIVRRPLLESVRSVLQLIARLARVDEPPSVGATLPLLVRLVVDLRALRKDDGPSGRLADVALAQLEPRCVDAAAGVAGVAAYLDGKSWSLKSALHVNTLIFIWAL